MSNHNTIVRSPSMESLGSMHFSFSDDNDSHCSADEFMELLDDDQQINMEDFSLDLSPEKIIVSSDQNDSAVPNAVIPQDDSSLSDIFSPTKEMTRLEEIMGDQNLDFHQYAKDVPSLLTGELLEEQSTQETCISMDGEDQKVLCEAKHSTTKKPLPQVTPMRKQVPMRAAPKSNHQDDTIARIMGFLHYAEPDRELVQKAEQVVQDCYRQYQQGKKRKLRTNLNGAIFERLVGLLGGPRFNQVYQASMSFDLSVHPGVQRYTPPSVVGPDTLQIAIAYGIHIARLHKLTSPGNDPQLQGQLVTRGVQSFKSMSVDEQKMFWDYATKKST